MSPTALLCCILLLVLTNLAYVRAQATRTWVSGVGDDANPCSRTAPCKTFAGAISKTAVNGEIDCLDPGGFGALTITKSITIDGGPGVSSVLVAGTNGLVISGFNANISVTLRNLAVQGLGPGGPGQGLSGIKIINAATVYLENVLINGFSVAGVEIDIPPNDFVMQVFISDSHIADCTVGIQVGTNGTASPFIALSVDRTTVSQMGSNGIEVFSGKVAVSNSVINQNNFGAGAVVFDSELDLFNNQINFNQLGVDVLANSTVRLVGNDFSLNSVDIQCAVPLVLESGNAVEGVIANGCVLLPVNQTTSAPPSGASTLVPFYLYSLLTLFA